MMVDLGSEAAYIFPEVTEETILPWKVLSLLCLCPLEHLAQ